MAALQDCSRPLQTTRRSQLLVMCMPFVICCMVFQVSGAQTPMLRVYTAAGKQLGSVAWEQQSIAAMAWTLHEELMVLDQAGEVMLQVCFVPV